MQNIHGIIYRSVKIHSMSPLDETGTNYCWHLWYPHTQLNYVNSQIYGREIHIDLVLRIWIKLGKLFCITIQYIFQHGKKVQLYAWLNFFHVSDQNEKQNIQCSVVLQILSCSMQKIHNGTKLDTKLLLCVWYWYLIKWRENV